MAYISFQPNDYFNTKLYTGNGSTNAITGVGFQPDWVWIKHRGDTHDHNAYDAVRGVTKMITPNENYAESTVAASLTSFDSDGFTLGNVARSNASGGSLVSWNWRANGAGVSNTDGSITSTVSANTTSGFSIVTYTSGGGSGTVGHGLNSVPKVMFYKPLSTSGGWDVYHHSLGISNRLNLHNNAASSAGYFQTLPTSSVFTEPNLYSGQSVIMYCFAEKKGFSAMGSYIGNGSADGSFIYTNGMKPAMVIIKLYSTGAENWRIFDNKRIGYNPNNYKLYPSGNFTEGTSDLIDIYSNGFKLRSNSVEFNGSGNGYIYIAFAESSIVSSNGVPAVAR